MKISKYRQFTTATRKEMNSQIEDSIHCILGISSELLDELATASLNSDIVNIGEELGDANWFLSEYANIWDLTTSDNYIESHGKNTDHSYDLTANLVVNIGKMHDLDKGAWVYGKEVSKEQRQNLLDDLWTAVELITLGFDLDSDKVRATNLKKLNARFGDKFDAHLAKNRDLAKELEILSS